MFLYRTEKSKDIIVLEIGGDIKFQLPHRVEEFEDKDTPVYTQQYPKPSLRNILFLEFPELRDKDKEKGNS